MQDSQDGPRVTPEMFSIRKEIGRNVKRLRKAIGISQTGLADLLCTSYSVINRWENGKTDIGIDNAQRIASALNIDVHFILAPEPGVQQTVPVPILLLRRMVALWQGIAAVNPGIEPLPYSLTLLENTTDILSESLQGLLDESPRQEIFPASPPTFTSRDVLSRAPRHTCLP